MNDVEFESLERGDIIRHKGNRSLSYVVDTNMGKHNIIGVRTVLATNPDEWEKITK